MIQRDQDGPELPLDAGKLTAESAPADRLTADSQPIGMGAKSIEVYTDERGIWRTREVGRKVTDE